MCRPPILLALLAVAGCLAARPSIAQVRLGEFGFTVQGQLGSAGDGCWGFDCTPRPLTVVRGETLQLLVRAPLNAPYVIVAAPKASSCVAIPSIGNMVVLDPPLFTAFAGFIDQQNTMRYCYDGFTVRTLPVPQGLPPGIRFAVQAVAQVGTALDPKGWVFSSAVVGTLQ